MPSQMNNYLSVVPYEAPKWVRHLTGVPKERVVLATLPTPVYEWKIPNIPNGFEIFIKRDDMTGSTLSGNKVRKLEFLLGQAIAQGCQSIITLGLIQSNHCRATAVAARELNLDSHIIVGLIQEQKADEEVVNNPGNLLPLLFSNSKLYLIPNVTVPVAKEKAESLSKLIRERTGNAPYYIPGGGSSAIGLFGYINAWEEMMNENNLFEFEDVVVACGSGGVVAGLAIANYLTEQRLKIHGICISRTKKHVYDHLDDMLTQLGILDAKAEDIADVIDSHVGAGYGSSTSEDRELYLKISGATGIICDPSYTGKAVKGMLSELENNPTRFKGKKILFIHTGGLFGLYFGAVQSEIKQQFRKNTYVWPKDSPTYTSYSNN